MGINGGVRRVSFDGKNDVFVHYTAINGEGYKTLDEGDTVTFDVVADEKGSHAVNVSKVQ